MIGSAKGALSPTHLRDEINRKVAIYVLTVKTFAERIASMQRQLSAMGLEFEFVFRYDANELASDPPWVRFKENASISKAERSLDAKHCEAWRLGSLQDKPYVLVLEDDVIFLDSFVGELCAILGKLSELSPGFLVNLGGENARVPLELYRSRDFFFPYRLDTAEGYLSDKTALGRRLDWLAANELDLPADHALVAIDRGAGIQQYWPKEALLRQGSLMGMFSSTLNAGRAKRFSPFLRAAYQSKKFRRRTLKKWIAKVF